MKERPILMSAPMVRAILTGQKTQTRRLNRAFPAGRGTVQALTAGPWEWSPDGGFDHGVVTAACPHGAPGDRLWVRETWGVGCRPDPHEGWRDGIEYRADATDDVPPPLYPAPEGFELPAINNGWRPSIFMPRALSRITMEITSVRAERLHSITDEDIAAEGVTRETAADLSGIPPGFIGSPIDAWKLGWDAINGKRATWASDPWVWVISFRRLT